MKKAKIIYGVIGILLLIPIIIVPVLVFDLKSLPQDRLITYSVTKGLMSAIFLGVLILLMLLPLSRGTGLLLSLCTLALQIFPLLIYLTVKNSKTNSKNWLAISITLIFLGVAFAILYLVFGLIQNNKMKTSDEKYKAETVDLLNKDEGEKNSEQK